MGRRRTKNHSLPPLMTYRRGRYYYGRNQVALGPDFPAALRAYAELHGSEVGGAATFAEATTRYLKDCLRDLAPATQRGYERQAGLLVRVFGAVRLDDLAPSHVETYMQKRGRTVSATREKALLSVIFNHARASGLTKAVNPCTGIRGKSSRRERYVTDAELRAALDAADPTLAAFLELAYRTGQRPSDVLRMTAQDAQDGLLSVVQAKTGARVRVRLEGPLAGLWNRLTAGTIGAARAIRDARGSPLTLAAMRKRWDRVRAGIGADWQIRDLRAKAGTDLPEIAAAQMLLGHRAETTTAIYRRRVGEIVGPVMREIAGKPD